MAFDFKKEYKEFYMPKNKPVIVNVPEANYIAVRGEGNPNEEGGAYQQAIGVLYAIAYTLRMSYKTDYKIVCLAMVSGITGCSTSSNAKSDNKTEIVSVKNHKITIKAKEWSDDGKT